MRVVANELRPYHIKVYLSINFSSPAELGFETFRILDKEVQEWWNEGEEIYRLIPDFGGFLESQLRRLPDLRITVVPTPTGPTCWPTP